MLRLRDVISVPGWLGFRISALGLEFPHANDKPPHPLTIISPPPLYTRTIWWLFSTGEVGKVIIEAGLYEGPTSFWHVLLAP